MSGILLALLIALLFCVLTGFEIKKDLFSSRGCRFAALFFLSHSILIGYIIQEAFDSSGMGLFPQFVALCGAASFLICFFFKLHVLPNKREAEISFRGNTLLGGRNLIHIGLFTALIQIFWLFFYRYSHVLVTGAFRSSQLGSHIAEIPKGVMIADWVATLLIISSILLNGFLRVFLLSGRLRVFRRIVILMLLWIPIVHIFVFLYVARIAFDEYDHEANKAFNRQMRKTSLVCETKYPLLMLHGVGFRDMKYLNYWGRIPKELTRNGAAIYYGHQEAWGTVKDNAVMVKERIDTIIKETGCEKVNIIAHSKGGLDARYAISILGAGDRVATLTTMSSPHRGCRIADITYHLPEKLYNFISRTIDWYFQKLGDINPDFKTAVMQFSTIYSEKFNREVLDHPEVYYQSYVSVMKNSASDSLLSIPHFITKRLQGENDGLVPMDSAKWGNFRGVFRNRYRRGISHGDIIDLKREDYKGFDVIETYVAIVSELKEMGY